MANANTRPNFTAPFPSGTKITLKSYKGHNPDLKKMDIYAAGWPSVVASAPGVVHEHFEPGGIEIRHYIPGTNELGNWYTTYMHMSSRVAVGTKVGRGNKVGTAGSVGTGVKHLHFEQLRDKSPNGDADTQDMEYPSFVEYNNNKPFKMPLGNPGISFVSQGKHPKASPKPASVSPSPKPRPKPGKKSIHDIAKEVIRGDWGNGPYRRKRLSNAGYNADAVQREVNRQLS